MNIRTAILKAADSIEQNPHLFDYDSINIPEHDCGTPGCAIGWIAFHAGVTVERVDDSPFGSGMHWPDKRNEILDVLSVSDTRDVYDRMNGLSKGWERSAKSCASALRQYADKYHPAEIKHTGIPHVVRSLFDELEAA